MLEAITTNGKIRFEIIEPDIYYDDPVWDRDVGEDFDTNCLGVFIESKFGTWILHKVIKADDLSKFMF